MAFCRNCGNEIHDDAIVCPKCGVQQKPVTTLNSSTSSINDRGGLGWGLLGFFVPIAGLIIYLLWQTEHPKNAKAAGIGALVYLILIFVLLVIYFIFGFAFLFLYLD